MVYGTQHHIYMVTTFTPDIHGKAFSKVLEPSCSHHMWNIQNE